MSRSEQAGSACRGRAGAGPSSEDSPSPCPFVHHRSSLRLATMGAEATNAELRAGYEWMLSFGERDLIEARIEAERQRIRRAQQDPAQLAYGPFEDDRVAGHLMLVRAALEAPTNLDLLQASRVLPVFTALGANAHHLASVGNVGDRVRRWFSPGECRNPDAVLFELLVAALYVRNGWSATFIPEAPLNRTPDIRVERRGRERWVECKRLQPKSEAAKEEERHWIRLWRPLQRRLVDHRLAFALDVTFHVPLENLPDDFLVDRVSGKLALVSCAGTIVDDQVVTVVATPVDLDRIAREMEDEPVKVGTSREVQLITGEYRRTLRYSGVVAGDRGTIDDQWFGLAMYWTAIHFAVGAYWHCDAAASIEKKARDVRGHLAKAVRQLEGTTPSAVHVGIETLDGDFVEDTRYRRILDTITSFDARGTELDWIFCHLFGPEAPPDKSWDFGETTVWRKYAPGEEPLDDLLLVVPHENGVDDQVHWGPRR